jgi:hypothetical protein
MKVSSMIITSMQIRNNLTRVDMSSLLQSEHGIP